MSVKSETSSSYLEQQRSAHGWKEWKKDDLRVIIFGAMKEGSIGAGIAGDLNCLPRLKKITFPPDDIRKITDTNSLSWRDNNALILSHGMTWLDWFEDCPLDRLHNIIDVNLTGTILAIRKFVRDTLASAERKRIIVIGSMAHRAVLNGSAVYCASKAGVAMLVRCLAWELAPKGYDVFIIHPSNTSGTPMTRETIEGLERYRGLNRRDAESYWNDSPIRSKILTTDDISELVLHLLGPYGQYLAGAQLELAGGQR